MTTKRLKRGCTSTPNSPGNRTPPLQAPKRSHNWYKSTKQRLVSKQTKKIAKKESYKGKVRLSQAKDAMTPLAPQRRVKKRRRRAVLWCLKKTAKWNLSRAVTLSITGMAPGGRERKRKSFLASQMQNNTHIQNIHKNTRQITKFVKIKPEKDMAMQQKRGQGRVTKH